MAFSPNAATVFADGPSIDPNEPDKAAIRALLTQYETILNAVGVGAGSEAKATKAELFADLSYGADQTVWVYADPTPANNGIWRKLGAPGTGSFVYALPLPFSFIQASDTGAGTPNAIKATSALPIVDGVLVILDVSEANDGSPVTVQFNDGSVLTMKTNSGNDIPPNGLSSHTQVLGVKSGSQFRIASDLASAAIQAAAEQAAELAEKWAEGTLPGGALTKSAKEWALVAQGAVTYNRASVRGVTGTPANVGPYDVGVTIGSINNIDIKLGGVIQDHTSSVYTISGSTFTFVDDPGSGIPWEAVVQTEIRELGAPSDGTVGEDILIDGAVTVPKLGEDVLSLIAGTNSRGNINPVVKGASSAGTATYSTAFGTYRHENGMVHFSVDLTWTGATGTGDMLIDLGDVPQPANLNTPVSISAASVAFAGDELQGVLLGHTTTILMQTRYASGAGTTAVPMDAAGTLRMSGSYPSDPNSDIYFHGDSVTLAIRPGVMEHDSFRHKVQNALRWALGVNGGIGGENASEGEARFAAAIAKYSPQAVTLMFGINDFHDPLPVATFKSKLISMVNMAQTAGIKVTLLSSNQTQESDLIAGFGPYLAATQEVGAMPGVIYVPVYEAFNAIRLANPTAFAALFADSEHPGPTGHDLITATILATPGACKP
ncbi:SGNH/GDSL hydrolase family protein [Rhizobium leguminosarum]|uniref:SGNH/GDSL hydrolase family protein n=1 Tax=Rhizobium leguminosarum TaxID=384 RepID=UPI00047F2B85|nr:SGNH/GDSL hydrolase family protein [Rhizobium leguminosarum]